MKRRGFIQLLGAALTAPALPAMGAPSVAAATYNRYTFGLAVFHARTRAHVSAAGIAYRLKVSTAQAEAMIAEMASKGMVTPLISKPGSVRATSNILKGGIWDTSEIQKAAKKREELKSQAEHTTEDGKPKGEVPAWIAHLREVCVNQGMTLSPRCYA